MCTFPQDHLNVNGYADGKLYSCWDDEKGDLDSVINLQCCMI